MTFGPFKALLHGVTHYTSKHIDPSLVPKIPSSQAALNWSGGPPPDPRLPTELERYIFELAAWNDPRTCSSLIRVAKRVHSWIFALQHNVLVFDGQDPIPKMRKIINTRTPDFLEVNVKAVAVRVVAQEDVAQFLNVCKNVTHLAFITDGSSFYIKSLGLYLLDLRPRSVSMPIIQAFDFPSCDLRIPFFSQLTHLHLTDWPNAWSKLKLDDPRLFPALTHLAFSHWSHIPDHLALIDRILTKRQGLRELVLVVIWEGFKRPFGFSDKLMGDHRLVFMPIKDFVQDWRDFAGRGTQNMWAYAEQITWVRNEKRLLANSIRRRRR